MNRMGAGGDDGPGAFDHGFRSVGPGDPDPIGGGERGPAGHERDLPRPEMRLDDADVAFHQPVAAGDDFLEVEGNRSVDPDAEAFGFLDGFEHPGRNRERLAGQRPGGHAGPAQLGAAFDQADPGAQLGRLDRGREPGFPPSDHDRVEAQGFHAPILLEAAGASKRGSAR